MKHVFKMTMWQILWLLVFCLNLIVPLLFGWDITRSGGRVGMFVAIGYFWLVGHIVCGLLRPAAIIFVSGGMLVALSQLFPWLQIFAGSLALSLVGSDGHRGKLSDAAAFVATVVTGLELLTIASVFGSFIWAVFGRTDREIPPLPPPPKGDPADTAVMDLSASRLSR